MTRTYLFAQDLDWLLPEVPMRLAFDEIPDDRLAAELKLFGDAYVRAHELTDPVPRNLGQRSWSARAGRRKPRSSPSGWLSAPMWQVIHADNDAAILGGSQGGVAQKGARGPRLLVRGPRFASEFVSQGELRPSEWSNLGWTSTS
jgi:hypothetical protein